MKPVRALEEALKCDKGRGNPHEPGKPPRAAETIDDFPFRHALRPSLNGQFVTVSGMR